MPDTIVLAFSGGLDTSFCVPYLRETAGAEVVTVTVDTGGMDDAARAEIGRRALALGAREHRLVDGRAAFFDETLRFLLAGNVLRGHAYPLCVGAERGLQARLVAEAARAAGARAVAHGSTAAGNDQVRFEVALRALAPGLEVLAPIRDGGFARADEVAYLARHGFEWPAGRAAYSINAGLWGVTIGGKETNDTVDPLPEDAWVLTRGAFEAALPPRRIEVDFERGVPVALDGTRLDPVTLIEQLNRLGGSYGIGRGIHLGDTILGLKGRVGFEAPAALLLITAHRELEKLTLTGRQQRVKDQVAAVYGDLVHEGQALDPAARDIEALLARSQERVTGRVRVLLRTGTAFIEGVASPHSLKAASSAVYGEAAAEWTAADARGFSRLLALPAVLHARAGRSGQGLPGGTGRAEQAGPAGQPGPAGRAAPAGTAEQPGPAERAAPTGTAGQPGPAERAAQAGTAEQPGPAERAAPTGTAEQPGPAERAAPAGTAEQPGPAERAASAGTAEQPGPAERAAPAGTAAHAVPAADGPAEQAR